MYHFSKCYGRKGWISGLIWQSEQGSHVFVYERGQKYLKLSASSRCAEQSGYMEIIAVVESARNSNKDTIKEKCYRRGLPRVGNLS